MLSRLYFPVSLEDALAVLRKQKHLDQVCATECHTFFAYSERDAAVRQARQNANNSGKEICFVVVECPTESLNQVRMGDGCNFGPCAEWHSEHVIELHHIAEGIITQHATLFLELVRI
jgi:hypothetical protein